MELTINNYLFYFLYLINVRSMASRVCKYLGTKVKLPNIDQFPYNLLFCYTLRSRTWCYQCTVTPPPQRLLDHWRRFPRSGSGRLSLLVRLAHHGSGYVRDTRRGRGRRRLAPAVLVDTPRAQPHYDVGPIQQLQQWNRWDN